MKIYVSILFAAVVSVLTIAPSSAMAAPKPASEKPAVTGAETVFNEGRSALYQGDYEKAIELLKKASDQDKTKTSYRLYLARAYRYAKKDGAAEKLLVDILKSSPDHVEAGQLLAEVYASERKWESVVQLLEPLLKYRHDYPTYHFLGEATYNLNDYAKARKYFEEAVKLNPNSGSDHYQLGNIYLSGNFFALAAESYRSALRLGIDTPVLHYKLASAYFNLRNYFGKISLVTIKAGKAGTLSGEWYLIEPVPGKKDHFRAAPETSAIYQVAKAIAGGIKDRPDIHFLRGNIYLNARRYARAYEIFSKIAPKIPKEDKALFYYYYAEAALGTGRYSEYLTLLQEAIKLDKATYQSTLVDAYLKVAEQYNQAGQLDKYIEYLVKAVNQNPETASLHLKLGHAYKESRQYAKAVVQWRMVLDLEPDHPKRMELLNLIKKHSGSPGVPSESKPR